MSPRPSRPKAKAQTGSGAWKRAGLALFGALGLFLALFCGNLLHYFWNKRPLQRARARAAEVDLPALPAGLDAWRPGPPAEGDPWEEYQLALLEFRAREKEFITLKLRSPRPGDRFDDFAAIALLPLAARRASTPPMTLAAERQIRGRDLRDCCVVLRREAERLGRLAGPDRAATESLRLEREAEDMLRAWLATGVYLARRRHVLDNVEAGAETMRESLRALGTFLRERGRAEEAADADRLLAELEPFSARLAELRAYDDDDADLEVWARMLKRSNSPAAQLLGARRLADAARRWWRFGESSRAIRALRAALVEDANASIRSALFDLLHAAEQNRDIPSLILGPGGASDEAGPPESFFDALF